MTLVSGWGRFPVVDSEVLRPRSFEAVGEAVVTGSVARGNGRAYGDAAIGAVKDHRDDGVRPGQVVRSRDRAHPARSRRAAVRPNRHLWSARFPALRRARNALRLGRRRHRRRCPWQEPSLRGRLSAAMSTASCSRTGQGETIEASREQNSDAFFATVGGMGLTGVILEATMRLRPVETGWIRERVISASDLDAAMRALDASDVRDLFGGLDRLHAARGSDLGRSLIYLGEHASAPASLPRAPIAFPLGKNPGLAVPDRPAVDDRSTATASAPSTSSTTAWARGAPAPAMWSRSIRISSRSTASLTGTASTDGAASSSINA